MHVLLIEDDPRLSDYVAKGLCEAGHHVDAVADGRTGLALGMHGSHDVLVVDRMLPGLDGLGIVKALRAAKVSTPVLLLSALGSVEQRIAGLETGADDYLTKPFAFSELTARLVALGRRPAAFSGCSVLTVADLELDLARRAVVRAGEPIEMRPSEFELLAVLMRNAGRVISRQRLLEQVWGYQFDPQSRLVETQISRLRARIDNPWQVKLLHTIRNIGYSVREPR